MKIFTEKEAKILLEYYSKKIVGNPIGNGVDYKIDYLESKSFGKDKINIFCISKHNYNLFTRKLTEYIEEFNLISPQEVLNNQDL